MIINVNGQLITVADRNLLVSGSVNIYGAVVNFSPEWEGFEKVIVWKRVGAAITEPIIRPIVNGIGSIPNEIVSDPGRIRVGVAGVTATKRMPTVWSEVFEVVPGAYPGAFIPEPGPDIWQQFAAVLEEIRREAAETISTAGEVMQTATNAAQASADKAAEANQSASNAAASAQSAAESASAASASKAAASQSASDAESAKTAAESAKSAAVSAKDDAFASMREADAAATRAAQSATNAANTLASVNAQANARKAEINELASAQKTQIADLTESKKAEIQSKGDEVLASIPEDYIEVLSDIGELKQDKADKSEVELLRKKNAEQDYEIEVLKAVTKGIDWIEHEDASEAMVKTVPAGAEGVQIDSIGAKSAVWNQLASQRESTVSGGISFEKIKDGVLHATGTATRAVSLTLNTINDIIAGHKYYIGTLSNFVSLSDYRLHINVNAVTGIQVSGTRTIWTAQTGGRMNFYFVVLDGKTVDTIIKPRLIDLTVLGMDDIASVDDPRIAWIENYAELHPEYNSGEIVDGVIDSVVNRGRNMMQMNSVSGITGNATTSVNNRFSEALGQLTLDPNTAYRISFRLAHSSNAQRTSIGIAIVYTDGTRTNVYCQAEKEYRAISEAGKAVDRIFCLYGDANVSVDVDSIIVEKYTSDLPYVPYKSETTDLTALVAKYFPNGMHSAGDVYDRFDFERMKAVRFVEEKFFNGSEQWKLNGQTSTAYEFYLINDSDLKQKGYAFNELFSNRGDKPIEPWLASQRKVTNSFFTLSVPTSLLSSFNVVEFKEWLSNNNQTILYDLIEPIETDLDPADIPMLKMLVEAGGTLTFANDALLDIPSTVTYAVKTGGVA